MSVRVTLMKLLQELKEIDWAKAITWFTIMIFLAVFWATAICLFLNLLTGS